MVDILQYKLFYTCVLGMEVFKPLNYTRYVKKEAETFLAERFGWQPFLHKHHESRFTRFYEDYWMPKKFGYEKRRAHLSSLVLTKQMTREVALQKIAKPVLDDEFHLQEFAYVAKKLDLTVEELRRLFEGENKTYHSYRNKRALISLGATVMQQLGLERRLFR